MSNSVTHDKFFRKAMQLPKVNQAFIKCFLPKEILNNIDIKTLKKEKTTYIDEALRERISDVVFTCNYRNKPAYFIPLVEHQSTNDPLMSYRVHQYMMAIFSEFLINHPNATELPFIYPMIISNTDGPCTMKMSLPEITTAPDEMKKVFEGFQLIDLNTIPDDELRRDSWLGVLTIVMKHRREKRFIDILDTLINDLSWISKEDKIEMKRYIRIVLCYNHSNIPEEDEKEVKRIVQTLVDPKESEELMATFGESFIEEGKNLGIPLGEHNQAVKTVKNMLEDNESCEKISKYTGLPISEIEKIKSEISTRN